MPSGPALVSRVRSVVVLRALTGLGDQLCSIPALRALRARLPAAHVAVLTVPAAEPVLRCFPQYVDELIRFAGFPGIPEQPFDAADLPSFYQSMVDRRFDLAIQMQGNGLVSNSLVVMLGATATAGYYLPGQYCPDVDRFLPYPAHLNEIHRHLALAEFLGCPSRGDHLEFPVSTEDRTELAAILVEAGWEQVGTSLNGGGYACIHPGAMAPPRRWSPQGFARVADEVAARGLTVVLTGQAFERGLAAEIRACMQRPALDLTGRTSLGTLAALVEGAALVVSNDTGVSHLAAALRVPSVVIFAGTRASGSDPGRWAPLDARLHRVVAREAAWTSSTAAEEEEKLPEVSVPQVLLAVREQLAPGTTAGRGGGSSSTEGRASRVLVAAPRGRAPGHVLERVIDEARQRDPRAEISLLEEEGPWAEEASVQWDWITRLRSRGFDEAVLVGDGTYSPYPLAYAFYLACIPVRRGVTGEFGGRVLTERLLPLSGAGPAESHAAEEHLGQKEP